MPDAPTTTRDPSTTAATCPAMPKAAGRSSRGDASPVLSRWAVAGVVGLFVLIGHGWSVTTGLYLDDYAHFEHLRDGNWSYRSAVDSARLGIVGEVLDLWGRQEAGLRFYRPIAFWIMRIEYTLVGWNPLPMHMLSLGWHFACSLLVGVVATRALGRRFWGMVAACLMAIHPAHVGTVYWIACQTELLTTLFLLIGLLAYARYAGWPTPWFGRGKGTSGRGDLETRACGVDGSRTGSSSESQLFSPVACDGSEEWCAANKEWCDGQDVSCDGKDVACDKEKVSYGGKGASCDGEKVSHATPLNNAFFAMVAMVCYALALGCRENAALFPLVCWLGDRLIGTSRRRWIRWEHVGLGLVFVAYMALRWEALGGFPVPPPPYLMPVSASWEFVQYVAYKVVVYALGLFLLIPVVPVGSRDFFAERLDVFYGLFAGILLLLVGVWWAYRFRRSLLWPLAWLGCLIAPMMLVFASPHHLYLPGLGMVLLATAGLAAVAGAASRKAPRWPGVRAVASGCLILVLAGGLGGLAWSMGFSYVRGVLSEDLVVRDVKGQARPLRDGDHLFFINLPVLAYYAVPAIEQELGYRNLQGHVLVFSPDLIRMDSPSEIEVLDRHRLRVRAPENSRYLAGTTGTMLLGVMGIDKNLHQGQEFDGGLFKATITDMDAEGVRELLFEFREPIDSPNYHFYLGSPQFMAYELMF